MSIWYVMPIVSLLAFLFVFWTSSKAGQSLIEKIAGVDFNHDGYIGEPPHSRPVRIELVENGGQSESWIDLPYPEKLPELAEGLLSGRSYALKSGLAPARYYSRPEFEQLRDVLIKRGLARWKNPKAPNQGWELSASGRAVMRRFSKRTPSPTR